MLAAIVVDIPCRRGVIDWFHPLKTEFELGAEPGIPWSTLPASIVYHAPIALTADFQMENAMKIRPAVVTVLLTLTAVVGTGNAGSVAE